MGEAKRMLIIMFSGSQKTQPTCLETVYEPITVRVMYLWSVEMLHLPELFSDQQPF